MSERKCGVLGSYSSECMKRCVVKNEARLGWKDWSRIRIGLGVDAGSVVIGLKRILTNRTPMTQREEG